MIINFPSQFIRQLGFLSNLLLVASSRKICIYFLMQDVAIACLDNDKLFLQNVDSPLQLGNWLSGHQVETAMLCHLVVKQQCIKFRYASLNCC